MDIQTRTTGHFYAIHGEKKSGEKVGKIVRDIYFAKYYGHGGGSWPLGNEDDS